MLGLIVLPPLWIRKCQMDSGTSINLNKNPVKIEYKDLNNDGIKDRILTSKSGVSYRGMCQVQFGYKNKKGQIEYLTREQIIERAKGKLEVDLSRYEVK